MESRSLDYILEIRGFDVQELKNGKCSRVVNDAISYWRRRGFPYCESDDSKFARAFERLSQIKFEQVVNKKNYVIDNPLGLSLANYFHPQMWHIKVKNAYTPFDRFSDDVKFRDIVENSMKMWPHRKVFSPTNVRNAIRIYSKTRSPTNFRPTIAKAIIERYTIENDTVLDFSAGFGGRLLGCLPLKRSLIAVDPADEQVNGLRSMVAYCQSNFNVQAKVKIVQACAETYLRRLRANSISLVFTSPPYFNYESYGGGATQSHIKFPSYDLWKTQFLDAVIKESHRIIKRNGYLVINIKNIGRLSLEDDFLATAQRFFELERTLKMKVASRPYRNNKNRFEPIYVLRKVR